MTLIMSLVYQHIRNHLRTAVRQHPSSVTRPYKRARVSPPALATKSSTRPMARSRTRTMRRRRPGRKSRRMFRKRIRMVQPWSITRRLATSFYNVLDPGAGALTLNIVKLNSGFDPSGDASAVLQPLGMDQYEGLYKKYCVIGWKLHIQAVSSDNTNSVTLGFTPTTTSTTLSNQHRYIELPGTVYKIMTPDQDKVSFTVKGGVKRWLLPRGGKLLTDDLSSSVTSSTDPSKLLYGHIWVQPQDSSADASSVKFTLKLEQIIVFYDPVTPARSTQ